MLRLVLLVLLMAPLASACSFPAPPEPPGTFLVWDIGQRRDVASVEVWERQGALADCSLTNPMAFDGQRLAWAEGSAVHVAGLAGGRWTVRVPFEPRGVDLAGDVVLALKPGRDGAADLLHAATLDGTPVPAHLPEGWSLGVLRDGLAPAQRGNLTRLWDVLSGAWESPAHDLRLEGRIVRLEAVHFDRHHVAVRGRQTSELIRWDTGHATTWPHRIEALDGDTVWVEARGLSAYSLDGKKLSDHPGAYVPLNAALRDGMVVLNEYTGPAGGPPLPTGHAGTSTVGSATGDDVAPPAQPAPAPGLALAALATLAAATTRRRTTP